MSEQGKFLEELEAVKSIAASQDNKLTKDEVKKYLSDLELSDDKMEQVDYYLSLAPKHSVLLPVPYSPMPFSRVKYPKPLLLPHPADAYHSSVLPIPVVQ